MTQEAEGRGVPAQLYARHRSGTREDHRCPHCDQKLSTQPGNCPGVCERCVLGFALESTDEQMRIADHEILAWPDSAPTIGPYVLIEEIGRGGMGVIYRAVHRDTQAVVAVKTVLAQDLDSAESSERFRREALAAQSLDHPHSMPIFEVGKSEHGVPFFSMKLAEGGSLYDLTAKYRGRWRQTAELMIKIADAVQHAHARGILHRDLKPGNILFTQDHVPLVADFGLVKHLTGSDELTRSHAVLGTPSYVAPEQASGQTRDLTAAADIYSLGAILFDLLTGRPPFVGDNVLDVLQQVTRQSAVRARRLVPSIPTDLDAICMRCLERRPEDRYSSARDFADDLRRWLEGRRIVSRPLFARVRRTAQRVPVIFTAILAIPCILTGACGIWAIAARARSNSAHLPSIAVAIDDLNQDGSLKEVARRLNSGLEDEIAAAGIFRRPDRGSTEQTPPTEVFDPLRFGRSVNAEMILTGTVHRVGDGLRITSRLMRCDTGIVVWRNTAMIPTGENAPGQHEAARAIIAALQRNRDFKAHRFTGPTPPLREASEFYTKAMELTVHKNSRDMKSAIELFQRACELDPQFVQARAMLALALLTQATTFRETSLFPLATSTAMQAVAQDPTCSQAHRVVGACYFKNLRYEEALPELWRGVELDPQAPGCVQALGVCLREMGRPEQALPWLERAVGLAPGRGAFSTTLGETLALCGRDEDAERVLNRAAEIDRDRADAELSISVMRAWQNRFAEARRVCVAAREQFADCPFGPALSAWIALCSGSFQEAKIDYEALRSAGSYQHDWEFYGAINPSSALAFLAMRDNDTAHAHVLADEAFAVDRQLLDRYPKNARIFHDLAATSAVIGDLAQAQSYLARARALGWVEHRSTRIDPRLSAISTTENSPNLVGTAVSTSAATARAHE